MIKITFKICHKKKEKRKKEASNLREGRRESRYVLLYILVTAPTFQAERSPLKVFVSENTTQHRNKKVKAEERKH